jgi:hypothetical protein
MRHRKLQAISCATIVLILLCRMEFSMRDNCRWPVLVLGLATIAVPAFGGDDDSPDTTQGTGKAVSNLETQAGVTETSRSAATGIHGFTDPRDIIVAGSVTVDVMDISAPPRIREILQRFQKAIEQNPSWLLEAVKESRSGGPLRYDPRMGLSEAEYKEFLDGRQKRIRSVPDEPIRR